MTRKLNEADRAAVDLLFDQIHTARQVAGNGGSPGDSVFAMAGPVSDQRIAAVKKVLSLLDEMPEVEVPPDLAARTIARVNRDDAGEPMPVLTRGPFIDPAQPQA